MFYHTLTQANKKRPSQLQCKAGKLVGAALHYTSQIKLKNTLAWESVRNRAEIMGLTVFHKIHFNLTRPLVPKCLTGPDNNLYNLRNNGNKRLRHPYINNQFNNSFFFYTLLYSGIVYHKNIDSSIRQFLRNICTKGISH